MLRGLVHLRHRFAHPANTWLCSLLAALISPMMSVTRLMPLTTSVMLHRLVHQRGAMCHPLGRWHQ
ncbi:MAG: hypothetical protein IPN06_14250 [Burkholderiales bacterium]|nr:hypothetical protein [Burkholderiales bacterium]